MYNIYVARIAVRSNIKISIGASCQQVCMNFVSIYAIFGALISLLATM